MMWILILGELAVFGALLLGFSVARTLDPATFADAQNHLHRVLGGLNTLVLVTSGFLVAAAIWHRREGRDARLLLLSGMALGLVFIAVKGVEYGDLIAAGTDMSSTITSTPSKSTAWSPSRNRSSKYSW